MKYIKAFIIIILILWGVSAPIAAKARPGSLLSRLQVMVNDPLWAWIHITGEGRSETVEAQLAKRYIDMERAFWSNQQWQKDWALKAEGLTVRRVFDQINISLANKDYKSADTLATHALAITRAHKQILTVLLAQEGLGESPDKVAFLDDRLDRFKTLQLSVSKQFTAAYDKVELVRGIDEKLLLLEQDLNSAQTELDSIGSRVTEAQRVAFVSTMQYAKNLYSTAQNRLGNDQYVEGFRAANQAQGYVIEVNAILDAVKEFNIPAMPSQVPTQ